MKQTKKQNLVALINELDENEKISIHNEYCDKSYWWNGKIYYSYEIDELYQLYKGLSDCENKISISSLKSIDEIKYDLEDYSKEDRYFYFDAYNHIISFNTIEEFGSFFPDEIADGILERDDDFGNNEIREFLDENVDEELEDN